MYRRSFIGQFTQSTLWNVLLDGVYVCQPIRAYEIYLHRDRLDTCSNIICKMYNYNTIGK